MVINRLLVVGFFMVLIGAVLPFLILVGVFPSTFLSNFISFASSVIGVFLGVLGIATYVGKIRRKEDDWQNNS